jgi:hypothetical protein
MNNLVQQLVDIMDEPHVTKTMNVELVIEHETIWNVQFQELEVFGSSSPQHTFLGFLCTQ